MRNIFIHIAFAAVLLAGCKGGEAGKKVEMGPEAVAEAFTRHIAAGEFEEALGLCDTASMQTYIDQCINAWERLQKKDSSVLAIASSLPPASCKALTCAAVILRFTVLDTEMIP